MPHLCFKLSGSQNQQTVIFVSSSLFPLCDGVQITHDAFSGSEHQTSAAQQVQVVWVVSVKHVDRWKSPCMQVTQQPSAALTSKCTAPTARTAATGVRKTMEEGEGGGLKTRATHFLTFLTSPLKDCYLKKWHTKINALG